MTHSAPRFLLSALVFAFAGGAAAAQTPARPAFDVAAITAGVPLQTQISTRQLRIDRTVNDSRINLQSVTLAELIMMAYKIQVYQLTGPDWIKSELYDVQATLPPGSTKEQVPAMMETLLAERFKLTVHRDKKEHGVYGLVVGKDGHKLMPAAPAAAPPPEDPNAQTVSLAGQQIRVSSNGSATVTAQDGATAQITQTADGGVGMTFKNMTVAAFAQRLTSLVDKPVMDMTGLAGTFDIPLELKMEDILAVARGAAQTLGVSMPGLPGAEPGQAPDPSGSSVFASVQKLGLKLEPRKEQVETVVVDSAEKTPTAN